MDINLYENESNNYDLDYEMLPENCIEGLERTGGIYNEIKKDNEPYVLH